MRHNIADVSPCFFTRNGVPGRFAFNTVFVWELAYRQGPIDASLSKERFL